MGTAAVMQSSLEERLDALVNNVNQLTHRVHQAEEQADRTLLLAIGALLLYIAQAL